MSDVVLFEEHPAANGQAIGVATLNSEKSLNALSLDMIQALMPQLTAWETDPKIACVWLQGAGEKAFCAGGDIVAMYKAMANQPGTLVDEVADFFTQEYRLDYLIHTYAKPFIVWGHGIVMGGGMGLMNGASHRVVTERSLLAMPEVTIGLYPDVGATAFLNQMPDRCGLYLGLTGATMNASDALFLGLADQFIGSEHRAAVLEKLAQVNWADDAGKRAEQVTEALTQVAQADTTEQPAGQVEAHRQHLAQLTQGDDIASIVDQIVTDETDDKWLSRARQNLQHGCPITAHIVWNQLAHGQDLSLADCFRLELTLSTNCAVRGDFAEGIRALLIDKDKQPKWQHKTVAEVTSEELDGFFTSPWSVTDHPLVDIDSSRKK